jgi:hypothetical protein
VARPANLRRVKTYSAASGIVYSYYFFESQKARRGFHSGAEYIYVVAADRGDPFPISIFVRRDALERSGRRLGRALSGTEEYALAKMRLFQAFDELESITAASPSLVVDDANIDGLLAKLDL